MIFPNGLDEEYSKLMLDLIHELTGLSVSLYINDKRKTIYSNKYWPEFCVQICNQIDEEICGDLFPTEDGLRQCKAGLWCRILPLYTNNKKVGYFSIGHRRLEGKDEDSFRKLACLLKVNQKDCIGTKQYFINLFNQVPVINVDDLYDPLIDKVSLIEKDIIRKNQEISEFKVNASRLAHQFLLPIQSIIANSENLYFELETANMNDECKAMAIDILEEVTKLAYIADSIRAHMASGKVKSPYHFDKIEVISLINESIKLFRREASNKNVLIEDPIIRGKIPFSMIEGSKPHLEIVFFNIYHNAVKYSYFSSLNNMRYISTRLSNTKNKLLIEVSNYGVGILEEEIEKGLIFLEGYRGEQSRDKWRTGSGIGLSVVKSIIEAHGGSIQITSANMGKGLNTDPYITTVKIELPFIQKRGD